MLEWEVLDFISHSREAFFWFIFDVALFYCVQWKIFAMIFNILHISALGNFNWISKYIVSYLLPTIRFRNVFCWKIVKPIKCLELFVFLPFFLRFRYVNEMQILTLGQECYLVAIGFIWRLLVSILDLFTNETESATTATTTTLSSLAESQFN